MIGRIARMVNKRPRRRKPLAKRLELVASSKAPVGTLGSGEF
jgi:hypothetical protein